jgi:hypothetical protein
MCCNDCTRILQVYVPNVSHIFSDACCKCVYLDVVYFYTYVASVLSGCCICLQLFLSVFAFVSDTCFECFSCFVRMLQLFYLDVSKVDRSVVHVAI